MTDVDVSRSSTRIAQFGIGTKKQPISVIVTDPKKVRMAVVPLRRLRDSGSGRICLICGQSYKDGEPIFVDDLRRVYRGRLVIARITLCLECTPDSSMFKNGRIYYRCPHCQRPVFHLHGVHHKHRRFCSKMCRRAFYSYRHRLESRARRQSCCTRCGIGFLAARKDAKYCSGACKQAAFRDRQATS